MKKHVTEKYKGQSFSDTSMKVSNKYKDRDLNRMSERSFNFEIGELMKHQERLKLTEKIMDAIKNYRKPTNASKYVWGGTLPTDNTVLTTDNELKQPFVANVDGAMKYPILQAQPGGMPNFTNIKTGLDLSGVQDWVKNDIYAPVTLGKGLEFAGKLAMLASGYDKVNPEYNPYESDIRTKMASRRTDLGQVQEQIASGINAGLDNTRNVRSEAVRQALNQNLFNTATTNLANTSLQEQDLKNQYGAQYASTLDTLGQQRVQANRYAEQLNQQAKGNYQLGLQGALETVGNAGQKLTDYRAGIAQQRILTSMLQTSNFQMGDAKDILNKAEAGERLTVDDFIKLAETNGKTSNDGIQLFLEYKKKTLGR